MSGYAVVPSQGCYGSASRVGKFLPVTRVSPIMANDNVETILAKYTDLTENRYASVRYAAERDVDDETLVALCEAIRLFRKDRAVLPAHRYENLSRGRGWARKGRGDDAEWGDRTDNGYRVGPGRWIVGSNDGFSRKGETTWNVRHVTVGAETWTLAS